VLHIGRFFVGGHPKRQDLLISAFRDLCQTCSVQPELHLVGGVSIGSEHQAYVEHCQRLAEGLPVFFHFNADKAKVSDLLGTSSVYWHGTGMDVDAVEAPWTLEHFGISICEAMNAGCIPMAPNCGGPVEIIENGVTGYLFNSSPELVELTRSVIEGYDRGAVEEMRLRAVEAGGRFTREAFCQRWDVIISEVAKVSPQTDAATSPAAS
jgi:glycosyltransferase involved in cell wall biosynthesis